MTNDEINKLLAEDRKRCAAGERKWNTKEIQMTPTAAGTKWKDIMKPATPEPTS